MVIPVPAGIHARPPPPENVNRDTTNYDHTDTQESGSPIGCPAASMPRTPIRRRNLARERQIPSRCHRFPVSVNKYRPGVWRPDEDRRLCSGDSRIAPVGGPPPARRRRRLSRPKRQLPAAAISKSTLAGTMEQRWLSSSSISPRRSCGRLWSRGSRSTAQIKPDPT